ncbi:antA/AntB antirepressor family protein [Avibacterium paragallinarum]|uniref:antA/AntB antirepressor family protein n=1 Tax=Avibacterium paragallinarum TaxID=728 RepID=UPI0021F6CB22|nr:antA/AntB antirepressor family protein [Avibacterium paragallinarum]UXN34638.1 antA/AntB antirepressor family protein [Avibacterium paragallinarum]
MTTNTATTNALNLLLEPMKCQFQHKEINCVNSRNLHHALGSKQEYSTWIKKRIKQCQFIEGQDFIVQKSTIDLTKLSNQKGGNMRSKDYIITFDMAKHLCLLEKNEVGHAIRQHFIEAEKQFAQIAPNLHRNTVERTQARLATIDHNRAMTDAIKDYYQRQGKESKPYHFSNEQVMLDSLVIGENLHHWKARTGVTNVRESFTTKQLSLLKLLQQTNTTLLVLDMPFSQRKSHLTRLIERGAK